MTLAPDTLVPLLMLKVELKRHDSESHSLHLEIQEEATKDIDRFMERFMEFEKEPEAHADFLPDLEKANAVLSPAYHALMKEEVEVKRPLLNEAQLTALCAALPLDGPSVAVFESGQPLTPLEQLEAIANILTQ